MVKLVFDTLFYEWDGSVYRQKSGGPIGLRSTGVVCRVVMDFWRTELTTAISKMDSLKIINTVSYETITIRLLRKYVDDIPVALEGVRPGVRYDHKNKILQ